MATTEFGPIVPAWRYNLQQRVHKLLCAPCRHGQDLLSGRALTLVPPLTCSFCDAPPGVACTCED